MIHEVRLPRETQIYLWQIVHLQMDVLDCVAHLSSDFTQSSLRAALAGKMPSARAERVARWIFRNTETLEKALRKFVRGNSDEKRNLVISMCQDVLRLYWGCPNTTLECCFQDDKSLPEYRNGAKDFLADFYERLDKGLDTRLFRSDTHTDFKYGREQFFAAFERENPGQYMCAICDEHRYMTILRGKYFSDIEHYFPRSIYPHLSCHPYNLVPICKPCNQAHLNRDPLQPECGERRVLGQIFLPYRAESVLKSGVIRLDWHHRENKPHLEGIQPRQDQDSAAVRARFQAFSEIYNIPGRWQDRIHQIGEQLWRRIRNYVRLYPCEHLNVQRVKTELEGLLGYLLEDMGREPYDYVLIWYLANMIVEELEKSISADASAPLLDTIKDLLVPSQGQNPDEVLQLARGLYP